MQGPIFWALMLIGQTTATVERPLPTPLPAASLQLVPGPEVATVPPPGAALGWADLAAQALANNPTIRQAEAQLGEARGRAVQAGLYPNPRFVPWDPHNLGDRSTVGKFNVFVQQPIVTGGKLRIERQRAEVAVQQAEWILQAQQRRVLNGLRLRYDRVLARQRLLALNVNVARTCR